MTIGLISSGVSPTPESHQHPEARHLHDGLSGLAIKHLAKKAMVLELLPRPVRGSLKRLGKKKRKNIPLTPIENEELDRCIMRAIRTGVFEAACEKVHCSECEELLLFMRHINANDLKSGYEVESSIRGDSKLGEVSSLIGSAESCSAFKTAEIVPSAELVGNENGDDDSPWSKEELKDLPWSGKAFLDQIWEVTDDETPLTALKLIDWARSRALFLRFEKGNSHVSFQPGIECGGRRIYPLRVWSNGDAFIEFQSLKHWSVTAGVMEEFRGWLNCIEGLYVSEKDLYTRFKFNLSLLNPEGSFDRFADAMKWFIHKVSR